jgi:hypothetical protein
LPRLPSSSRTLTHMHTTCACVAPHHRLWLCHVAEEGMTMRGASSSAHRRCYVRFPAVTLSTHSR